jgi:hypothetical protein
MFVSVCSSHRTLDLTIFYGVKHNNTHLCLYRIAWCENKLFFLLRIYVVANYCNFDVHMVWKSDDETVSNDDLVHDIEGTWKFPEQCLLTKTSHHNDNFLVRDIYFVKQNTNAYGFWVSLWIDCINHYWNSVHIFN